MYDATVIDCMIDHFCCQCDALQEATTHANTLAELEAFKSSTEAFGFSQSLLAFADHDQALSQSIPAIPSLETYLVDTNIDITVATEGVITVIKQTAQRFLDALLMHITKYKDWYIKAVTAAASIAGYLGGSLIGSYGAIFGMGVALSSITVIVPPAILTIFVGGIVAGLALRYVTSVPLAIKEALELKLPADVQARSTYVGKIRQIFKERAHIDINKLHVATLDHHTKGLSAREMQLTKEGIERVVDETKEAVEAIKRCNFIPERLEELAHSIEASTSNGRAALLFLTSLITKVMHLSVQETMKAAQAVRYVAHHAHHMAGHADHEPTPAA